MQAVVYLIQATIWLALAMVCGAGIFFILMWIGMTDNPKKFRNFFDEDDE